LFFPGKACAQADIKSGGDKVARQATVAMSPCSGFSSQTRRVSEQFTALLI
jgi:hypothetical protein